MMWQQTEICHSGLVLALGKTAVKLPLGHRTEFEYIPQIKLWLSVMYDFDSYNVIIPLFFNYVKMLQERREIAAKQVTKAAGHSAQWKECREILNSLETEVTAS